MVKRIALGTGIILFLGLAAAAVVAVTGARAGLARPGLYSPQEPGSPGRESAPAPPPTPAVSRFVVSSERVFVITVGPEPPGHLIADRALDTARQNGPGGVSQALRTKAYLLRVGDLRVRSLAGNYPRTLSDQQAIWAVVYQGIPSGDRYEEHTVWLDAVTGTLYGAESRTSAQPGVLASSPLAVLDPSDLPRLVLPTPQARPAPATPAAPYPIILTEAERQLTLDIGLRDPVLQRATTGQPYEIRRVFGWQDPAYGRVGKAVIYLKGTAVSYEPAVDLANKKVVFKTTPIVSAPGQMIKLTDQEEQLAREVAYASDLVKQKVAAKTLQGDYAVGYLNEGNSKMAIVVVYIGPELTYQATVDLTSKAVISNELKAIVAFRRPEPAPWRLLTPTPVKSTPTPTPSAKPPYLGSPK